jgi:hypothetical protein
MRRLFLNDHKLTVARLLWLPCLRCVCCAFCLLPGISWLAGSATAAERSPGDWVNDLRVGVLVGFNIDANFTVSGRSAVSGSRPGLPGVSGEEHFYDDGYVRVDQTGNALGYTSFWGYNDAGQYDSGAQTLTMHSASTATAFGEANEDDAPYVGFDMAYGRSFMTFGEDEELELGWEFGFDLLPIEISDNTPLSTAVTRTVHTFDTGGILLPTAPYNGGPDGLGPTILDVATAQPGDIIGGSVTGSRTIDVTFYALKLGPTLSWRPHERVGLALSAGPALGIVDGDLEVDETIRLSDGSTSRNRESTSTTDVLFGGYVSGLITFRAVEDGDFYLGVQFMPMGTTEVSGSGRKAELDLGGSVMVSGGVNWPF